MPVADLHVVRAGRALARLDQRLQAHQEAAPLRAAVVHELDRLLPAFVLEQHGRELSAGLEIEAHLRADKNLTPETAAALSELFRVAYTQFSRSDTKKRR